MRYLFLIYDDEKQREAMPTAERQAHHAEYIAYSKAMSAAGVLRAGDPLKSTATATTVRVRSGKSLTTDGPFAETKEQLGGYYLVEVPSLDQALEWAARCPGAKVGSVEVRPIMDFP